MRRTPQANPRGPGKDAAGPRIFEHVEAFQEGKLVAAICHGPWVLCSAKVLDGRGATSFSSIKDDVINAGAQWRDAAVVTDGNLVTSRKPEDLPAFCRACIKVLAEMPVLA